MEVRIGSEDLRRSTLKSLMSSRDSEKEGRSSSRVDSKSDKTEETLEGGLYKRPHVRLERLSFRSIITNSIFRCLERMDSGVETWMYTATSPPC